MRTGIGRCDADLTKIRAELADLATKRVRVDLGDVEYLWEELVYEDPDRIDYVRTVVMQVCERVELMPRGRGSEPSMPSTAVLLSGTPEIRSRRAEPAAGASRPCMDGRERPRYTTAQDPAGGLALGLSRYTETVGSPAR
ncbi:hypothetical protein [Streptomyces sp. NPDC047706]|uniref:hypothetical protein n=1 Tax=Streptomyces sp. NPDC047706 TaxID=3365486 RepID=UPI003710F0A9